MEPYTSLILTKIRPPACRSRTVHRDRLLQRLVLEPGIDLVMVCAPAGYGKTTLLVEWAQALRQAEGLVAWYALDENDNNPVVFGAYLVASLEHAIGPGSGLEPVSQVLRTTPEVDLLKVLPIVINSIGAINRDIVLVLDDYHLVRDPVIHQVIEFLIRHRPENFHLAMGSRANPPLPLARLRAKGHLVELRTADLQFTEEETERFLRVSMRLDLPAEHVCRLAEQVEGWAAGLQLAALSLPARADQETVITTFSGGHRRLAEYLLEEVVNQLPENLQSFLLYTSIFERMSAPLCDAILEMEDSAALLQQLEQANLFVSPLDQTGTWYRYHHLFRDFLLTWLTRTQPACAAALHRAAASWLAAHGSLREAAYHAFRSGDLSFAADFVELHSFTMIIHSDITTIYEWCSTFPETVLCSRPKLSVFQGLALAYRFQGKHRARVEACLQKANQAMIATESPAQASEVSDLTAVVHTFLAMIPDAGVDAQKLLDLAESHLAGYTPGDLGRFPWLLIAGYAHLALYRPNKAQHLLEESVPLARQAGLFYGVVEASFHLARLAHSQGRLSESLNIAQNGQAEFAAIAKRFGLALPALGCLDIAAGCVLLEQDHLEEAEQRLRQGLEQMGWGMNPYYLMTACLAQFRLFEIQGRFTEALTCLDQLDALWPDIHLITQGYRAQIKLRFYPGDPEAVQLVKDWLQNYLFTVGDALPLAGLGPIGAAEAYYQANLIWARLQTAMGRQQAVLPYVDLQLQRVQESGLRGREIELKLIKAQILYKQGQPEQALAVLEEVLTISRPIGVIQVFNQGPVLDELIHQAAIRGIMPPYLERILSAIRSSRRLEGGISTRTRNGEEGQENQPDGTMVEPLSERELDVLYLIAAGATNQAIAERFVITVGTVKSHIHHIFGKLNARNRTEAVANAKKLGLIDHGTRIHRNQGQVE